MKTKRRLSVAGMIFGALLMLAPMVGLLGTVFGMTNAFRALSDSGPASPQVLADSISGTLLSTFMGLLLFPVGIVILVLSLVFFFRLRAPGPPVSPTLSAK